MSGAVSGDKGEVFLPSRASLDCSIAVLLLQFFLSVRRLLYMCRFISRLFVWFLEKVVLRDCGLSFRVVIYISLDCSNAVFLYYIIRCVGKYI